MERQAEGGKEALALEMQAEFKVCMGRVMAAVDAAPVGKMIEGSEVEVHALMREFEQQVYQTALQARIQASEPAAAKSPTAFSPSGQRPGP